MAESVPAGAVRKPRSKVIRGVYLVLGLVCVGFAYMSFLPGIPTFDFVILAAFFFARSSDRFHGWLVNHRVFGRVVRAYGDGGLTVRTKVIAVSAMLVSLAFSAVVLTDDKLIRTIIALAGVVGVWFIISRPTRRPGGASASSEPTTA